MKKGLCLIGVLFIVSSLMGSYLDETKTMDTTLFSNLYDAIDYDSGHDEVMRFYWNKWMESANPNPTSRYEGEDGWRESRADYDPINWASTYAKNSLIGALAVDIDDDDAQEYLNNVQDHLIYNPYSAHNNYLNLDSLWVEEFADGSFGDCLTYATLLNNVSFIVDNLWHYNVSNQTDLYTKLEELAGWANELLNESNFGGGIAYCTNTNYPPELDTRYHNGRIRLAGALGYAGCVLGNEDFIETAEYDLFERSLPGGKNGFIEFMTSNSGTYNEGISYTEYTFKGLTKFFVARKRLTFDFSGIADNENWFEDDRIRSIYVNSLDLISPSMTIVPFDDVHETYMNNSGRVSTYYGNLYGPRKFFTEAITYYYQSPNIESESRDHIKWLVNNYKSHSGYANYYTAEWNTNKFYAFEYDTGRILAGLGNTPEHLTDGIYSNEELTILRRPIQTYNDYQDYPVLYINHENSIGNAGHEHSDQSSFILYYKDIQLLIDPGYRPSYWSYCIAKEWLASPFAHNVIMVNPYDDYYNTHSVPDTVLLEENELDGDYRDLFNDLDEWNDPDNNNPNHIKFKFLNFEPIGDAGSYDDINPLNPAFKNYLVSNSNTTHLQIELDYDHPQIEQPDPYGHYGHYPTDLANDSINIKRNFYSFDLESEDSYFIIFDKLTSSDHTKTNEFMNQLHFSLYPVPGNNNEYSSHPDNINDPSLTNGRFTYTHFQDQDTVYLHGAMGNNGISEYSIRDTLPQGLYYCYTWTDTLLPPQWMHKCMRTKTSTDEDEQFLTLLIPSEDGDTPIEYVENSSTGYGVKYKINPSDTCDTYAAVYSGDTHFRFIYDLMQFNTSADFFLVKTNEVCSGIKKLILNGDNSFEIQDMSGTLRFDNVFIFDSDYDSEEVIAEWSENNELEITTVMKFEGNAIPDPVPNPKYKILRCNVLPEYLISKTYYYLAGDLPQHHRGTISNNIGSLAFDENYFYVNYEYEDFVTANLLTEELTIYSGTFDNIEISGISKFGLGEIEFSDEITIPIGTELKFISGSNPLMAKDTQFVVSGQVTAIGDSLNIIEFDKISSYNWEGFYIDSDGAVDFQYCKFSSAKNAIQCFGDIDLTNSEITNCDYGLQINSPTSYKVNDTAIFYGKYGVIISNTSSPFAASHFENNFIYDCQYGLFLYNTNAEINNNAIYNNDDKGVYISRRSHPVILSNYIGNTRNGVIDNPEIYLIGDSYPVLDYKYNDIVIESGGSSKSIYNASGADNQYYCRSNFWGDGITTIEIIQSFYPPEWEVIFQPICDSTNTGFTPPFGVGDRLFDEGLEAEMNGNLVLAKQKYLLSIEENPDDVESLWSASRLLNCVDPDIGFGYNEAQQLYENIMTDSLNTDLYELAKQSAINCDRKMENFQEAIYQYEIMFDDSLSIIDSVFTQLDIVYTYMEAEAAGGRASGIRFISDDHAVRNSKHAKEMENDLLALLMQETNDGGVYSPIVVKVKLHGNFPNPFNPTTMISFSIPDESKVELTVYNIKGQKVKTLVNESLVKGIHEILWNGRNDNNRSVASGVYFYKLSVNGKDYSVKKCLMLK